MRTHRVQTMTDDCSGAQGSRCTTAYSEHCASSASQLPPDGPAGVQCGPAQESSQISNCHRRVEKFRSYPVQPCMLYLSPVQLVLHVLRLAPNSVIYSQWPWQSATEVALMASLTFCTVYYGTSAGVDRLSCHHKLDNSMIDIHNELHVDRFVV